MKKDDYPILKEISYDAESKPKVLIFNLVTDAWEKTDHCNNDTMRDYLVMMLWKYIGREYEKGKPITDVVGRPVAGEYYQKVLDKGVKMVSDRELEEIADTALLATSIFKRIGLRDVRSIDTYIGIASALYGVLYERLRIDCPTKQGYLEMYSQCHVASNILSALPSLRDSLRILHFEP